MASVDIGMALNPKLRLLVCQGGGDLDGDTLDALGVKLAENDFQMILELVTRGKDDEDRCAVLIRDGRVVGQEIEADEPEAEPEPKDKDADEWAELSA